MWFCELAAASRLRPPKKKEKKKKGEQKEEEREKKRQLGWGATMGASAYTVPAWGFQPMTDQTQTHSLTNTDTLSIALLQTQSGMTDKQYGVMTWSQHQQI